MLKNTVALVTGAAGSLGSATCKRLVAEGCRVTMIDLARSSGKELADSLGEAAMFCPADVTSEAEVAEVVETMRKRHGQLNVVVNCASVAMSRVLYNINTKQAVDLERVMRSLNVSVGGTVNVCRLALGLMAESPVDEDLLRGVIINSSGFAAFDGQLGETTMSMCWGAIASLTLPLCREVGPLGIRVMGIAPGMMQSKLTDGIKPRVRRGLEAFIPSPKRLGLPEEYAELVLNIVRNKYLNGEVIRLDGGLRLNLT